MSELTAFILSAIPVGMAGGIYAYFLGQIFPQFAFDPLFDLSIALMGFLGGLGTVIGPLLGALVLESLQQYFTQQYGASQAYLIIYGALFLLVVLLLPRGVIQRRDHLPVFNLAGAQTQDLVSHVGLGEGPGHRRRLADAGRPFDHDISSRRSQCNDELGVLKRLDERVRGDTGELEDPLRVVVLA